MMAWRLGVFVIAASCARPVAPAPRRQPPTAAEIVRAMTTKYAAAKTYSDHGIVKNGSLMMRSFETTFVRATRFRFALHDEKDPRRGFVIWADGSHTYSRRYGPPRTTDDGPGLAVALALAAKPSLGVVQTVSHLLQADAPPGPELTDLHVDGNEPVDDHPCWIVSGRRGDVATTLWIDRASSLLRRSSEDLGDGGAIAQFTPVLDAAIDIAQITPPDFSDDYLEGSPMLAAARALVNTRAPAFDATIVNGTGRATLAGLAGHVAVIDFWATWCGPCRMTIPRLVEWQHKFADRGLRIVGLSSEDTDDIQAFVAANAIDYTIARDDGAKIARAYNVSALPMLVVVDRAGVVRYATLGAGELDAVEAVIESMLR